MNQTTQTIKGFSKLNKEEKIEWIAKNIFQNNKNIAPLLKSFWNTDSALQKVFDEFSENTLTNFYMPFGVAPNFIVNNKSYCVPMVIEESSVVAAAANASKFWATRGGFHAKVIDVKKIGQVHFLWEGQAEKLKHFFPELKQILLQNTAHITSNMEKRGGGILDIELVDKTDLEPNYYQLKATFNTCDSMGANFINSVLEEFARTLSYAIETNTNFNEQEKQVTVVMSILSNYTPECLVKTWVECDINELGTFDDGKIDAHTFAKKFEMAVKIAKIDVNRATTHNKGIFNGIDAVVIATGNDFRAVEACGHTYAARSGKYQGLTDISLDNDKFVFSLEIPLSVGTVGGLTALHPLSKFSLEMLGNPSAEELMMIIAATGLSQNFAALKSLVTTGIQKGHMKMHLLNILNHLQANTEEVEAAKIYFADKIVSFSAVRSFLIAKRENLIK